MQREPHRYYTSIVPIRSLRHHTTTSKYFRGICSSFIYNSYPTSKQKGISSESITTSQPIQLGQSIHSPSTAAPASANPPQRPSASPCPRHAASAPQPSAHHCPSSPQPHFQSCHQHGLKCPCQDHLPGPRLPGPCLLCSAGCLLA
jgi:hypothetical protein